MQPVELPNGTNLKGYRFVGDEAEILGQRLDAARLALEHSTTEWAKQHWQRAIDQLLVQWRSLPALHDADAIVTIIPRWTIKYDYYERDDGIGHGFSDKIYERLFRTPNLDESWDRAKQLRYEKAVAGIIV